jgi:hypothetical protein
MPQQKLSWINDLALQFGDGVFIERTHPSTAFRSMPHFTTWDGWDVAPQNAKPCSHERGF